MGEFSIWHWLVVLAIVIVVFGTKRLRNVAGDLGAAVKGFREAVKDDTASTGDASSAQPPASVAGSLGTAETTKKKD